MKTYSSKPATTRLRAVTGIFGLMLMTSLSASAGDQPADNDMPPGMSHALQNDPTRGCKMPLPSRFSSNPQLVDDLPLTIRVTVIRLISGGEMADGRGPTDQSRSASWAMVSVDEVVKGELSEKTLVVNVGGGCSQMFRIGQSGYLTGKLLGGNPKVLAAPGAKIFTAKHFDVPEFGK
jgi:hypothetical protein